MEIERDLRYPMELLQQIAEGVNQLVRAGSRCNLCEVEVVLVNGKGDEFEFGLDYALDVIANDVYWDERGNWADARIALVRVL